MTIPTPRDPSLGQSHSMAVGVAERFAPMRATSWDYLTCGIVDHQLSVTFQTRPNDWPTEWPARATCRAGDHVWVVHPKHLVLEYRTRAR